MRLAIVSDFPDDPGIFTGGVAGVVVTLAETLHRLYGIDIHILSQSHRGADTVTKWNGITVHRINQGRYPGFVYYWTGLRHKIQERLRKINPDIVHFHGLAGITLNYRGRYVFTVHGINEKDVFYKGGPFIGLRAGIIRKVEEAGRRRAGNLIIISPYIFHQIRDQIRGKTWMIENPVSALFFSVAGEVKLPRVLFIGSIIPRKNLLGLLAGVRRVLEAGKALSLNVIGPFADRKYFETCLDYVDSHGLKEAVSFLGPLSSSAIRDEFTHASCLALLSHQETAPLVVGEAMAAGVPVLGFQGCGLPFMVEDGVTGYLVRVCDCDEIAQKLILLSSRATSARMGRACKAVASRRFHPEIVARKTMETYKEILDSDQT
jgi:glycosyltransferase involved in cell wall biosynthesis